MLGRHDLPGSFNGVAVESKHWQSVCPTGTIRQRSASDGVLRTEGRCFLWIALRRGALLLTPCLVGQALYYLANANIVPVGDALLFPLAAKHPTPGCAWRSFLHLDSAFRFSVNITKM
jgi:hypothetical protein